VRTNNRDGKVFMIGTGVIGMRPGFSDGLAAVLRFDPVCYQQHRRRSLDEHSAV